MACNANMMHMLGVCRTARLTSSIALPLGADKIGRGFYTSLSSRVKFTRKICASLAQAKPSASGMASTQKKVLVPIGFGTEEMEAVILIDVLRRAGSDVTVASVETDLQIEASRRVKLVADRPISACTEEMFDLIVLPGGMPGSSRLRDSEILENITKRQAADGRLYGAICAAPAVALETWGLLKGLRATCHPSFIDKLSSSLTVGSRVQKDGIVTTSRGPGTAIEFALSFIEQLYGKEKAEEVAKPMVLVPIANGSEEMEAVIIIDVLRRANIHVVVASVEETLEIVASRKVKIVADKLIEEAATSAYDLIVLPGGMPGAERLSNTQSLTKLLREQAESKKAYGAICASPAVVLEAHGLLKEKKATAHPAFSQKLADQSAADTRVVIDGNLITSRGPGTAMEFALAIVEKIFGQEKAISIAEAMVFPYP
ncbi:protein DJ-1 homolog A isoform X2 [Cryptomeria japonica]|uniref:protein DJ-1 homolog A isoform X2 n=1 Tax=Cryptomeria japonica TaxID=3369 RepID=UPI0025ABCEEE|nr:protein DJ-1 homolog A isoform X2 [Cryptomeria japonica]